MVLRKNRNGRAFAAAMLGVVLAIGVTACAGSGDERVEATRTVDAGGLTRDEAGALSLEEQFDLVRERDTRMQELLTDAQLVMSDGVWGWGQKGPGPITGPNAWALPGMTLENSYFMQMWRWTRPDGAAGAKQDLDPMLAYFEAQGWKTSVRESSGPNYEALADTGEGYLVSWTVKPNGIYNMEVMSQSYWGDSRGLLRETIGRIPPEEFAIEESVPGVYIPFPDWSDPLDYAPNLQDHSS